MRLTRIYLAGTILAALAAPAHANELRFAFQGDIHSMDPYTLNETFSLGTLGNVFEGLVQRAPDLSIQPALAESWEILEPTRWRFKLRQGVKFHDGRPFSADDVLFSYERALSEGSDIKSKLSTVAEIKKIDEFTIDIITTAPNPILTSEFETWLIMSKGWAEENDATKAESAAGQDESYANRHANGTGPFKLVSREADVRTVFEVNPEWWNAAHKEHNLTKVIFTPIATDSTRVAALLTGELDMAYPVPVQDLGRVEKASDVEALVGPEVRTVYLGLDQFRDELLYSNVKGKNPFKDKRVRQAMYQAIDTAAIKSKVMRGASNPSAMMIAPGIIGYDPSLERIPYDVDAAKGLLDEAGYPDGFEVTMDCPNDRYVNDEAICQAVVAMLAKIGINVDLLAQPKSIYFGKILAPNLDTSFFLLGWQPDSFDSWNPLANLHACPRTDTDAAVWAEETRGSITRGKFNIGGYCNTRVDELTTLILSETDQEKRGALLDEVWGIIIEDIAYIPLHQQAVSWGVRSGVNVSQRADNVFKWRHVTVP
ncbi:MAG: ABC transporter substrate-binding protein [Alphaproteobacteria bacterium]